MKTYFSVTLLIFSMLLSTMNGYTGDTKDQSPPPPALAIWVVPNFTMDESDDIIPANEFNLRHARIIAKSKGIRNWGYHVMAEMFGSQGNPVLMQAWVSFTVNKYLSLRFGQFKYPFGYEAYPALIFWKFVNPSYVTGGIVKNLGRSGNIFRDIGVQAAGVYPFSEKVTGLYKIMIMNGSGANADDNNDSKDIVGFFGVKLPMNLVIGGSYFKGTYTELTDDYDESALGIQVHMHTKKYAVQSEYIMATYKTMETDIEPSGFYTYGTYKITPAIEAGFRYDVFESNKNADNTGKSRLTLSVGYYFNKINRILLNYEIRDDDSSDKIGNLLTIQAQAAF